MYTVRWEISALEESATIWTDAPADARQSVTDAVHAIDAELLAHPLDVGESRGDDRRIHFIAPIGFVFAVDESARVVSVLHVWYVRPRSR